MKKDDDINWRLFFIFIYRYLKTRFFWSLSDLSTIPPFNILLYRFWFHNDFEDYNLATTIILEQLRRHTKDGALLHASIDHTFVYLYIVLPTRQKQFQQKLNKIIGKNTYYFHKQNNTIYKINMIRGKMDRSMLMLYNAFSS